MKIKLLLFFGLFLMVSACYSANKIVYVSIYNATSCHVDAKGAHKKGRGTTVTFYDQYFGEGTTTEPGRFYSKVPIIDSGNQMYAIIDNGDASDEWTVTYHPVDQFILSYDSTMPNCNTSLYQCVIFSPVNPCH